MESLQDNQREADLAYLAGILDGEGSITVKYNKKTDVYFVSMQVGMTETPAVELFASTFGGKVRVDLSSNKSSVRKKAMYRWETNDSGKIADILSQLVPYLRVKKAQALLAIEFTEGVRKPGGRARTSEAEKARRKELYLKVKELTAGMAPATTNRENT